MWAKKVVVGNPKGQVIVGTVDVIKSVGWSVRLFISSVESLNHLLIRAERFGHSIVVGKPNNLSDIKVYFTFGLNKELLCSKRVCTVSIGDKFEVLR